LTALEITPSLEEKVVLIRLVGKSRATAQAIVSDGAYYAGSEATQRVIACRRIAYDYPTFSLAGQFVGMETPPRVQGIRRISPTKTA